MSSSQSNGFMVLHSNQLEGLRELMIQFMQRNPLPVLEPEVILVQSNGMKHWLEITLAKELGICAATDIDLPSTRLWQIYRSVLGAERVPAQMPLDKTPLSWRLMRLLPQFLHLPAYASLQRYVLSESGEDEANWQSTKVQRRLFQLAQQIADVFDGYQNYRSDWLKAWARGDLSQIETEHHWQALLWKTVLDDLQAEPRFQGQLLSRSDVHEAFMQTLSRWPQGHRPAGLPVRLMVFGISSLPMQTIEALAALGRISQVLLWVQNPCQHYWGNLVESHRPLGATTQQRLPFKSTLPLPSDTFSLEDQYKLHTDGHPLLAAWGKQGRDYLHLLDQFDDVPAYAPFFQRINAFIDPPTTSQLLCLQSDILNLHALPEKPQDAPVDDHSIELMECHSAQREVEVLNDHIQQWLQDDPQLQPSDIMVMVPDMALFAPHIHAVMGLQNRAIPFHIADATPQEEPIVQALGQLLELPQLRVTHSEWQNWFDVPELQQRFELNASDVEQIDQWLQESGVRWGLDASHRQQWGVDPNIEFADQNSWGFGLQRLLLGYACGTNSVWMDTAASAGLGSLDAPLLSALVKWLHRITHYQEVLRNQYSPAQWVQILQTLVEDFFLAQTDAQKRTIDRLLAPLEQWLQQCQLAHFDQPVALSIVRDHWLQSMQHQVMHQRFFGGGVQFATLMPMRSIPFKIVCILGMNEKDYPRRQTPVEFDLMRQKDHWRAGDRSRRDDDRYLFLEAVLSARQKLYISWQGRRTHDHAAMPPSVLVAQLMDYLNARWTNASQPKLQPLQAFSPQYLKNNSPFFTYAGNWFNARQPITATGISTTQPARPQQLHIGQLIRLLRRPIDVYFQDRLSLRLDAPSEQTQDNEPFALDQLDVFTHTQDTLWHVFKKLVHSTDQAPADHAHWIDEFLKTLRLQGQLGIASLGEHHTRVMRQSAQTLDAHLAPWLEQPYQPLPTQNLHCNVSDVTLTGQWPTTQALWLMQEDQWLQIEIRPGNLLEGKAEQIHARGDTLCQLWAHHLLACASGHSTKSIQIGLKGCIAFEALSVELAQSELAHLVNNYVQAISTPIAISAKTACAYWQTHKLTLDENKAVQAAKSKFEGSMGELQGSPHLQRFFDCFEDIAPSLPHWSDQLYASMLSHAKVVDQSAAAGDLE